MLLGSADLTVIGTTVKPFDRCWSCIYGVRQEGSTLTHLGITESRMMLRHALINCVIITLERDCQ